MHSHSEKVPAPKTSHSRKVADPGIEIDLLTPSPAPYPLDNAASEIWQLV